jgi:hypothetical protein
MKRFVLLAALTVAQPAHAQPALEAGMSGALRGCEEWILNPSSWDDGVAPFISAVGLGDHMGLVESVDEAALPPKPLRTANHYWRINSTDTAGYILVVSDVLPMCHITGGGSVDLQPIAETVLASKDFARHWKVVSDLSNDEIKTTLFRNRNAPALSLVVSRAMRPGQGQDRVQIIATGTYAINR